MRGGRVIATVVALGALVGGVAAAGGGIGESDSSVDEVPDGPRAPGLDLESSVAAAETVLSREELVLRPQTFYVKNVHGQDFALDSGDSMGFSGFCVYSDNRSQVGAGIEFPTGAVITSISAHFDDLDAGSNVSVGLHRLAQSGTGAESVLNLASASSTGSSGNQEVSDVVTGGDGPGGAELVGDNEFFHLNLTGSDSNERMCGVEIFYNIPQDDADPVLHPVEPTRVYDSRQAQPLFGPLSAGQSRVISVADGRDPNGGAVTVANVVPAGATAIAYNLTVTDTVGAGFLSVTPGDAATFKASTINWASSGLVLANAGLVKLDDNRQIKVFGGAGSTDFIIDITGYYL